MNLMDFVSQWAGKAPLLSSCFPPEHIVDIPKKLLSATSRKPFKKASLVLVQLECVQTCVLLSSYTILGCVNIIFICLYVKYMIPIPPTAVPFAKYMKKTSLLHDIFFITIHWQVDRRPPNLYRITSNYQNIMPLQNDNVLRHLSRFTKVTCCHRVKNEKK